MIPHEERSRRAGIGTRPLLLAKRIDSVFGKVLYYRDLVNGEW